MRCRAMTQKAATEILHMPRSRLSGLLHRSNTAGAMDIASAA